MVDGGTVAAGRRRGHVDVRRRRRGGRGCVEACTRLMTLWVVWMDRGGRLVSGGGASEDLGRDDIRRRRRRRQRSTQLYYHIRNTGRRLNNISSN